MNVLSRLYYRYKKLLKVIRLYLMIAGPGIIVMAADNDAGGITTYTATGAQYGFHLIWFLILLGPIAYYVQEMTVRLGAVTKRGHAEAIFHAFGSFWGWFSLLDLNRRRICFCGTGSGRCPSPMRTTSFSASCRIATS